MINVAKDPLLIAPRRFPSMSMLTFKHQVIETWVRMEMQSQNDNGYYSTGQSFLSNKTSKCL